jgi:hypothetical protein
MNGRVIAKMRMLSGVTGKSAPLSENVPRRSEFWTAWSARGLPGKMIEVADCHHYAVLEHLAQPDGLLAKALAVSAATDRG